MTCRQAHMMELANQNKLDQISLLKKENERLKRVVANEQSSCNAILTRNFFDMRDMVREIENIQSEINTLRKVLDIACKFVDGTTGTCPADYINDCWDKDCENECKPNFSNARECWREYFMQEAGKDDA